MSNFKPRTKTRTKKVRAPLMIVDGPPGVEIQIIDGNYHVQARGTEQVKQRLPEGVYIVKWIAGSKIHEEIVRLLPIQRALRVPSPDLGFGAGSGGAEPFPALSPPLQHRRRDADIFIFERTDDPSRLGQLSSGIRLFNRDEIAMRSDGSSVEAAREQSGESSGWALRVYHVPPGNYRLRYDAYNGMTLDQTVVAIDKRRTMVFISQTSTETIVAEGKKYARRSFGGVDPQKTIVATAPLGSPIDIHSDAVRMAEILLRALSAGGDPLDQRMLQRIATRGADPLLRLYAVALILSRLEEQKSPALDDPYPLRSNGDFAAAQTQFASRWRIKAEELMTGLAGSLSIPDVIACGWQLGHDRAEPLTTPPMLVCCWEWAAKHSAFVPAVVPDTPSFRAASRGRVAMSPWLAWRASAAKEVVFIGSDTSPTPPTEGRDPLPGLSTSIQRLLAATRKSHGPHANEMLKSISPQQRGLIAASLKIDPGAGKEIDQATLSKLAGDLLMPAAQLNENLRRASLEIESLAPQGNASSMPGAAQATSLQNADPPALRLPVSDLDDPQKGRFGGLSKKSGFSLNASFTGGNDRNWVGIRLTVAADDGVVLKDKDRVEFFLHDTFQPSRIIQLFSNGRSELALDAFGGFTVGAWLPMHQVQLELDLAELADAPKIIKDW